MNYLIPKKGKSQMFHSDIVLVFASLSLNMPNGNFHMAKNDDME